jgi:hypothetical protein
MFGKPSVTVAFFVLSLYCRISPAQSGSVLLSPTGTQTVTQPVSSSTRSFLGINSLNNIYYVNQWCSTPTVLDDTCFSNAIADIQTHALTGPSAHSMQILRVPPGVYTFNHTVLIPFRINISITGEYQAGVWGSIISAGATPVDFFHVAADNIEIQHLSFYGGSGITAITLGTASQGTYDTHINWCWFLGQNAAIHMVNGGGYDLSHNTFDSGTNYGIFSNATQGDISANDIVATDLRGYGQIQTIAIVASSQSKNYEGYIFSGIFDHSVQNAGVIGLSNVINATISGIFNNNNWNDINIVGSSGVVISNFAVYNPGQTSIFIDSTNAATITNGLIYNSNTLVSGTPTISITKSGSPTVSNITTMNGGSTNASSALYIDSATSGSTVYGNNFGGTPGVKYNVNDSTASFNVQGAIVASKVSASNGFTGSKVVGSCTFTIAGGIVTNVSGC